MSALQRVLYRHMQAKGVLLTDGSEKDKKVGLAPHPHLGVQGGGFGTPGCVGPEHTLTSGPSTSLELIVVVKASSGSDLQGTAELLFKSQLV